VIPGRDCVSPPGGDEAQAAKCSRFQNDGFFLSPTRALLAFAAAAKDKFMRSATPIFLALALVSPIAIAIHAASPSAQAILVRISKEGGRKVLWDLWEHPRDFDDVLSGIESGDPSWLKVATVLHPYSDAAASLSLDYAVALALPKAPERVLALVGHGFKVEDICTSPFIEPDPGVAETYERQALDALAKVTTPALVPIAAECAKQVRLPDGT
jgi:hypothetical protein